MRRGPQDLRDGFNRMGTSQTHTSIKPPHRKCLSLMSCVWMNNDAQSHCGRRAGWYNTEDRKKEDPPLLFIARA